jgi:hypothetical protein
MTMRALPLALGALLVAGSLSAQGTCNPATDSREAELFGHFSVPLAFSPARAPWLYRPGTILVGLEGTYLPDASDRIATATTCQPGKGPENVNLLAAFPRPRIGFELGDGVLLEASWVPPVRINGVRPNLWSFALSRTVPITQHGTMFMGRAHATIGHINAPFTCSAKDVKDPASPICLDGEVSNDRYSPNIFGVELAIGWALNQGRIRPYLGSGYNILHPRFLVHFTRSDGTLDNTKIEVNLSRWILFGGLTWAPAPGFSLSSEAYTAPSDQITARVMATLEIGPRRRRR